MHRIVIWGFALAFIPLSIAVAWEAVVVVRSFFNPQGRKERVSAASSRER
jgi:hypothetical protein